jgi:S-adenosyl-L-methionine hydrolase (adenosine-forming)
MNHAKNFVTLTSDFGKQTQGVGNMEGVVYGINPAAKVIHLMHGIPGFDIFSAARTMETVYYMPIGCHVCVVDPGVGTKRKAIIIKVKRGDYFVGPDNGCLMSAPRLLGGIEKAVEITNEKYMITPVSPIFHGRHIFAPAAAHLANGVSIEEFGKEINIGELVKAPYDEALVKKGSIDATVIHVNHFGSLHLNILHEEWDKLGLKLKDKVKLNFAGKDILVTFAETFGDVPKGEPVIMKDDYRRVEIAINMGSFVSKYSVEVGDKIFVGPV